MIESLHQLISQRGFDELRPAVESRFRAHGVRYTIHYGDTPPTSSLFVRLESEERIGEVCAWESGDCEVQFAEFKKDGVKSVHHQLISDRDFHSRLADVFLFVTQKEFANP